MLVSYSAFEPVSPAAGLRTCSQFVPGSDNWSIYRDQLRHIQYLYAAMGLPGVVSFTCKGPPSVLSYTPYHGLRQQCC